MRAATPHPTGSKVHNGAIPNHDLHMTFAMA